MFKVGIRVGNVSLIVGNKEQWNTLVETYKDSTVYEVMKQIYIEHIDVVQEPA